MNNDRNELKKLLRAKISEKTIERSNKNQKEQILEKTLKDIGIDKEKFKADLEKVKQNGGLEIRN